MQASDIRNFAVVGHAATGKTLLCDAILSASGKIGRIGSIEQGTTVSDFHEDERTRQISLHASLLNTEWLGKSLNIIDCPGYPDFVSEVLSGLRVADFALVVVGAANGVEVGTDNVWKYARSYQIPRMIAVNQLDKEHTRFDDVLAEAREHFGDKVFPMTLPIDAGPGFSSILDVMRSEVITYETNGSGRYVEKPAEGELAQKVKALHQELIEYVAEADDALLEHFFENDTLSEEELRAHIHDAIQKRIFIPLFAVSAQSGTGVTRMLDFIAKYGSSPVDRAEVEAQAEDGKTVKLPLDAGDPVAFVFKTMHEDHVGDLSFFRVYSGEVSTGADLLNPGRRVTERLGQLFRVNGKERTHIKSLSPGDIGAAVKLRDTHTGDTLCSARKPLTLPVIEFPKPNIQGAILLKNQGEEERLATALSTLHEEDPTFLHRVDPEVGQTLVFGQGEIHLQSVVEAIRKRFRVDVELIPPRVPYRETIRGKAESRHRHKKQSGGAGQFAEVWMRIEPMPRNHGVEFIHSLVGNNVDRVFVPSVEKGVRAACDHGVLAGYRVVDVKADFFDGKQHPVDSKDIAFQVAGNAAFREAFGNARPCLLEPIMNVRVVVPDSCMGDVIGDLSGRRGRILGMDTEGAFQVINAQVPQAELYRYATHLRSLTAGRGLHSEEFSHYEEMPPELERRVIEQSRS